MIDQIGFKPVKIGGQELRAVAFTDPRNIYRMTSAGGSLDTLYRNAEERGSKNPALQHCQAYFLDNILYIPLLQMGYFRPTVSGSSVTYGCGITQDPRTSSFSNTSNITTTIYMGAGAALRGKRKKGLWFTVKEGDHGKGQSYSAHYHDGWMRHDKFTKDGRTVVDNDSMLICFNYDPGVGVAYAA
jgi:hypothetical protein